MNRFLRTAPTRRLLGAILGAIVAAVAGTTIALAAIGNGPVPQHESLARAIHQGLTASAPSGIYARINFTDNLIGSSEMQGSDPLLTGGSGRLWVTGHRLRLEVQGSSGDAQVVVNGSSFWAYDPAANTVFEGTLPKAHTGASSDGTSSALPQVAEIQSFLKRLAGHLNISGATPTDIASQPAYSVRISPAHNNSLLGAVQLAWDATHRVPLQVGLYARGDSTPVLALTAADISFGPQSPSVFAISPPAGAKVVKLSSSSRSRAASPTPAHAPREATGVAAVAHRLSFRLAAPSSLAGRSRQSVRLLALSGHPAALAIYGQGLGAILVLEQTATGRSAGSVNLAPNGADGPGLSLPTVSIHGSTAQQLETAIGTVVRFTRSGVSYTVLGSVTAATADAAARGL
jgi:outer membrane lipoprotein-sorting protein